MDKVIEKTPLNVLLDRSLVLSKEKKYLKILELVYLARFMDQKMQKLVRQNKGATFHLFTGGHELVGVMSALALTAEKDWGLPYYRDRAFALGLGSSLKDLFAAFLSREALNHSGGRMMPDHFSHKQLRIPCQSSVVGSQFLHAVGLAKAAHLNGENEVVYVSGGEGSTSQGDFHEALNYSCLHNLGVIFVIQDNGWAISVPAKEQTAGGSIVSMAKGYAGLDVHEVDGGSYSELENALSRAVEKGRSFQGPSLIVAKVPRLGPHSSSDDPKKYQKESDFQKDQARDPLPRFENDLLDLGVISREQITELKNKVKEDIEKAAREAENIPFQEASRVLDHVFKKCEPKQKLDVAQERGESIVIMDAINHALAEEMENDPGVIIFGQDVARGKGGVFGITRGLTDAYGEKRCFNTPLAESTIIGTAIGISLHSTFKPVVEIQFSDYMWTGVNQLFNELATFHYRSNGQWHCPIVIRMPSGGYIQGGPYHSQSIEAFLCHVPGLKVVMPSNAADAKMLLKSAIRDANPVIFLEHKALYRQRTFSAQPEPTKDELLPIGTASLIKKGNDLTVVCWGLMVHMVSEVASKLQSEGISVEVIDLRTLSPIDMETILLSVKKTSKLLIVHEAPLTCGLGAEIAARVAEEGFDILDAPVKRLGALNTCVPYAKHLEEAVLPQKDEISEAIKTLAHY